MQNLPGLVAAPAAIVMSDFPQPAALVVSHYAASGAIQMI
jgi:hypothetical protein